MALSRIKSTGIATSNLNLTVAAITANGSLGASGEVLKSNGTAVYWGTDSATAIGSDTQVEFNDNGTRAGASGLLFNKTTNNVTVSNNVIVGSSVNAASYTVGSAFIANSTSVISTGYANISTSVNSALLTVGTAFIANTTALIHTGYANVTGGVNAASYAIGTAFIANTTGVYHTGTVNTGTFSVGSDLIANSTVLLHTGTINAASFTTSGITANTTGLHPSSNTTGITLGTSTKRWNLTANSGNYSANIAMNSNYITGLSDPVADQDAATKYYVDTVTQGLHVHDACHAATTTTLALETGATVTYTNGTSGVGAKLTFTGGTLSTLDGYTLQNGDRVLVKNQANTAHNGIYTWATGGAEITRATDFDTGVEVAGGDFTFVTNGTLYNSSGWVQTDEVTTIGTDPIAFTQFSGQGLYTAGNYLYLVGSQFNVNATSAATASVVVARNSDGSFSANTITANVVGSFVNVATSVNSALLTVGTSFIANTTAIVGTGYANISTSVNSALLTVGTAFVANSTAIVGTGYANVTGSVNASSHTVGSDFIANSSAVVGTGYLQVTGKIEGGYLQATQPSGNVYSGSSGKFTIGTSSSPFVANTTALMHTGYANVTGSVNASSHTVGAAFIANSTAVETTGYANIAYGVNSSILTVGTAFIANSTAIVGTGYANVTGSVNSAMLTVGTAFKANSTALVVTTPLTANGLTGTSGYVLTSNGSVGSPYWAAAAAGSVAGGSDTQIQFNDGGTTLGGTAGFTFTKTSNNVTIANTLTVGTSFIANSSAIIGTGYANVTGSVNSALITVGTAFIANTTGAYHTGFVNAASLSLGSIFVANATSVLISKPLTANAGTGTSGQVLTSNGSVGSPYWSTVSGGAASPTLDPFMLMGA